jgi:plasmid stability protein
MAQLLIRKLDERDKALLQRRAKRNSRSMEAEAREILRDGLREKTVPRRGLGSEIVALFSGQGIGLEEGEQIQEIRGMRLQIPDFK